MTGDTLPTGRHNRIPVGRSFLLALMRIAIGWHFLYEGTIKLLDRSWSAGDYLRGSVGPLAGLFHQMAENAWLLRTVDYINIGALVLIGAALMVGLLIRTAAVGGMLLLALYYLAYPPFFGVGAGYPAQGHNLLANKELVELIALLVVLAMPAAHLGLDGILAERRRRRKTTLDGAAPILRDNEIVMNLAPADYWSATKKDEHDNVWCDNPDETIRYMGGLEQPWIAFKVLAAGAIEPKEGFRYAFANGADFICVGMYDFQIIEDVNIALEVLAEKDKLDRKRPWYA